MDPNNTYGHLLTMWGIQDSLLQSYRNIFIRSESVLFAIAVGVTAFSPPIWDWLVLLLLFLGWPLISAWKEVCDGRGYDVWFFHLLLLRLETEGRLEARSPLGSAENIFQSFKLWQGRSVESRKAELTADPLGQQLLKVKGKWGIRTRLDRDLPRAFQGAWALLSVISIAREGGALYQFFSSK
jgi:hypothetical protein